ncbi:hypothetical protein CTAYLR_000838 [Chrysophaeum taylorii]|uniref:SANT and BTB domain-containing protein n=1 Tax=Chrysophaeum taylorii TaxID=2483200 RepID=A0AAD7UQ38_9STRA|nr:hypothetical protein CTAYLR_000838 [Chrysophaeum taylorii]
MKDAAELIIIHVCDETRQINRDFACDRGTLLGEMKYFQSYLGDGTGEDIDISVHCDVHIFEWLVQWIHSPERPPPLDVSSVVSILISSEFLEMDRLVEHCLRFIAARVDEILRMPIDLACVSDRLVHRLAELCDAESLSLLDDKKDKLLPKLYKRRLEIDFRHRGADDEKGSSSKKSPRVLRCRYCHRLYPEWAQRLLPCAEAPRAVDVRGELAARHSPVVERWSLTEHVGNLHADGMSWAEIYWVMWGVAHVFRCKTCDTWFPSDDLDSCSYHDGPPSATGVYDCCGAPCLRFSPDAPTPGCKTREHRIDAQAGSATPATLRLLSRQASLLKAASKKASRGRKQRQSFRPDVAAAAAAAAARQERDETSVRTASSSHDDDDDDGCGDDKKRQDDATKMGIRASSGSGKASSKKPAPRKSRRASHTSRESKPAPSKKDSTDASPAPEDRLRRRRPRPILVDDDLDSPRHTIFRNAADTPTETISLRESRRDARERRESLANLSPRRRRAWELDCGWREVDVARVRHLAEFLCTKRKPWPDPAAASTSAHHREPQPCDWQLRKRERDRDIEKRRWR